MAKKNSAQLILAWVLLAMVIAGLGGFGIDNFLSQRATAVATVGDRPITAQVYGRALQAEMRAFEQQVGQPVTLAMAQAAGLDARVRSQLITQAALENEAARVGISVGDDQVARTIRDIRAFQGPGGAFDMDTYRFQLQNAGMTVNEFEDEVRREAARGILQAATSGGVETPASLRTALVDFYAIRHNFTVFLMGEDQLPAPVAAPDDATVQAYYDAHIDQFTAPETRHITYAWITPEMLLDTVEVDEQAIRDLYQQRISDYVQPERRLVERLVFQDAAAAQAARDRLDAGTASFEDIVAERGLTLDDIDLGDVSEAQLGAAGAAVFALTEPGQVAGPADSPLGPALFRMNAILNAQETPYDEARADLRAELAADRARRAIADQQESFDDLLAGGATLEQVAGETPMQLGTIDWTTESNEGIAAYTEFARAAAAVTTNDFPELTALSDGGLFALRLDSVTPPTPHPLDEVRDAVVAGARAEAVNAALMTLGQSLSVELSSQGNDAFAQAHGVTPETYADVTRLDRLTQIPQTMLESLMGSAAGTPVVQVSDQQLMLGLVGDTQPADPEDAQTQRLIGAIDEQIGGALAQDVYTYFANALTAEAGITLNQPAIDAVHTSFR